MRAMSKVITAGAVTVTVTTASMVTAMMTTATTVTMTMIMMVTATVIIRANQNPKAEKAVKNRESQTIVLIKTVTGTTIHIGMNIKQTMNY